MTLAAIHRLLAKGESEKVEFKKSTAQLKPGAHALCAFLNDSESTAVTPRGPDLATRGATRMNSGARQYHIASGKFESVNLNGSTADVRRTGRTSRTDTGRPM